MRKRIKIDFWDFWPSFDRYDNYFTRLLTQRYDLEISDQPDYVFFSCVGKRYRKFDGVRIFYGGENTRPELFECDYSLAFDYWPNQARHLRLPYYAQALKAEDLLMPDVSADEILASKTKFCNFVFSKPYCRRRNTFFKKLSQYKPVDSGGRHWNNVGGPVEDKLEFQRQYKFSIAFENSAYPGYLTEKLPEAVMAETLPIYWGDKLVHRDFNPTRFLNYPDYGSDEALIERVIELDTDDEQYLEYLRQPLFYDDCPNESYDHEKILSFFDTIFDSGETPVAQRPVYRACFQAKRVMRDIRKMPQRLMRKVA